MTSELAMGAVGDTGLADCAHAAGPASSTTATLATNVLANVASGWRATVFKQQGVEKSTSAIELCVSLNRAGEQPESG